MAAPSVGRILFETFVPEVPSVFELHAGLTPGLLFGPIHSQDEGLYDIRQGRSLVVPCSAFGQMRYFRQI